MNPTPGDVHVSTPLTNISIAYIQAADAFVASKVFPNIPVNKQADRYYTFNRGDFNRDEMQARAPGSESAGGGYNVDANSTYYAPRYSFHKDIPDEVRANSDAPLNPDRNATQYVTMKGLIKREKIWVNSYFKGGVWTGDVDGVASGSSPNGTTTFLHWSDANSDPISNVRLWKRSVLETTGFEPNVLVIGRPVYDVLLDHPDVVDRIKYGQTAGQVAAANAATLAALFDVGRVLVMNAIENTAKEGQTASHSFIGGKKALLCYAAPNPGIEVPSAGYTFSWTGLLGSGAEGSRIRQFRLERNSADRVEIDMSFDSKLVSADLGYFCDTVIA